MKSVTPGRSTSPSARISGSIALTLCLLVDEVGERRCRRARPRSAMTISRYEVVVGPGAVDVGLAELDDRLQPVLELVLQSSGIRTAAGCSPPTIDSPASTTSGSSMIGGLSCGLKSPCAPCSSAWSSQRASPKNTMITWRVM